MLELFTEKNGKKKNKSKKKKKNRIEKVIKRKGDQLYVKWKGYNNSFNSWIDKKDIKKKYKWVDIFQNQKL